MSDTPRTDAADLYDYQTAVEVCGELERELANAIAERDSETRWADKYAAESYRLEMICQSAHDRLLRGDTEKELLAILEDAWKGRGVSVEERRARTSNTRADRAAHLVRGTVQPVVGDSELTK